MGRSGLSMETGTTQWIRIANHHVRDGEITIHDLDNRKKAVVQIVNTQDNFGKDVAMVRVPQTAWEEVV